MPASLSQSTPESLSGAKSVRPKAQASGPWTSLSPKIWDEKMTKMGGGFHSPKVRFSDDFCQPGCLGIFFQ